MAKDARELFRPEQAVELGFELDHGSRDGEIVIKATDADAAVRGLALLAIRLAEALEVSVETVLSFTAAGVVRIGKEMKVKNGKAD